MEEKENPGIIGVDEAGRGPLAGPVFAAAVYLRGEIDFKDKVKDSKKLTAKRREEIYLKIISSPEIKWAYSFSVVETIDRINILEATKRAMERAIKKLDLDLPVVIDGNFRLNISLNQKSIPGADRDILECSLASIISKVKRDKYMEKKDKIYPLYLFSKHKGYGTKKHREMIEKYGPCSLHRRSFRLLP